MWKAITDTESSSGWLKQQLAQMKNATLTVQARMVQNLFVWGLGLTVMKALESGGGFDPKTLFTTLWAGAGASLIYNLDVLSKKYTISNTGIGYATVWPLARAMMNTMANEVDSNRGLLEDIDQKIDQGVRLKIREKYQSGIALMLSAYRDNNVSLPPELTVQDLDSLVQMPDESLMKLGRDLLKYSESNPPMPTVRNLTIERKFINGVFAILSTVIYIGFMQVMLEHPTVTDLGLGLASFAAGALGVKAFSSALDQIRPFVSSVAGKVKEAGKQIASGCSELLSSKGEGQ
jgi:hypothetical protein